jgi:copper homeostasis protein CutC
MIDTITQFVSAGLLDPAKGDGFVFGILKRTTTGHSTLDGASWLDLDTERNAELVAMVREAGFKAVLHRAVDVLFSQCDSETGSGRGDTVERVMGAVQDCGFDGMLTSGGLGSAVGNVARLREVAAAAAEREGVEVIVGGGVRSGNLRTLCGSLDSGLREGKHVENTRAVWFHSSCLRINAEGQETFDREEAMALADGLSALWIGRQGH